MQTRRSILCLFAFLSNCGISLQGQSAPGWSWSVAGSHIPNFKERPRDNKHLLVIELLFTNTGPVPQKLIIAEERFQAFGHDRKPLESLGLLFQMMNLEGARGMGYTGGMRHMETLTDVKGGAEVSFMDTAGPVEVLIDPGKSYRQRLLIARPKGKKPFRLTFSSFPALEILPPR